MQVAARDNNHPPPEGPLARGLVCECSDRHRAAVGLDINDRNDRNDRRYRHPLRNPGGDDDDFEDEDDGFEDEDDDVLDNDVLADEGDGDDDFDEAPEGDDPIDEQDVPIDDSSDFDDEFE